MVFNHVLLGCPGSLGLAMVRVSVSVSVCYLKKFVVVLVDSCSVANC